MPDTTNTNTAVAVSTSSVVDGLNAVNAKLAEIQEVTDKCYKAEGKVLPGFSCSVDRTTDLGTLIQMLSSVGARAEAYAGAQRIVETEAGVTSSPVFKIDGTTPEEWKEDIILRIKFMAVKEKSDKLKGLKKELEELMDRNERLELVIGKINNL